MTFLFKFKAQTEIEPLAFSRHALERVPQRTRVDHDAVAAYIRDAVEDLRMRKPCDWLNPPGGHWMVPLPGGSCAVLTRVGKTKQLIVKTILRAGMWDDDFMNRSRIDG